ncbi:hypothetical protein ACFLV7_03620, partial [Chloroflexota bacterium]
YRTRPTLAAAYVMKNKRGRVSARAVFGGFPLVRRTLARVGGDTAARPGFFGSLLSISVPDAVSNLNKEPAALSQVLDAAFSFSRSRGIRSIGLLFSQSVFSIDCFSGFLNQNHHLRIAQPVGSAAPKCYAYARYY